MSDSRIKSNAVRLGYQEIRTELFRKSIHIMVALVPAAASVSISATEILLALSVILYSICEVVRLNGKSVIFVSKITSEAARKRDEGHFILGPVTLALGAMLALMFYPSTAAAVAIYALAFGDSAASLIGKFFGRINLPGFGNKTLEGTIACFGAVYVSTLMVTSDYAGAIAVAFIASLIELIPLKDLDNVFIPIGTGLAAVIFLI